MARKSRAVGCRLRAIPELHWTSQDIEADNPKGDIFQESHGIEQPYQPGDAHLGAEHPRIQHVFIPKGACWLNLPEGLVALLPPRAFAGQSSAHAHEIERAMQGGHGQLTGEPAVDLGTTAQNVCASAIGSFLSFLNFLRTP